MNCEGHSLSSAIMEPIAYMHRQISVFFDVEVHTRLVKTGHAMISLPKMSRIKFFLYLTSETYKMQSLGHLRCLEYGKRVHMFLNVFTRKKKSNKLRF